MAVRAIRDEVRAAERAGVDLRYEHHVVDLVTEGDAVTGVVVRTPDGERTLRSRSVILASGGFEANAELRERYLGPGWQHAKVRGTPFNTGELILKALELGAARGGDWSSCHSVQWDAWTEENESNRELTNRLTRQSYILGIIVNKEGERFVDEGADFRNYTYAKYGADVLAQPDSIAFQVFDADLRPMLRSEEYEMPGIGEAVADTLEELAEQLGVDVDGLRADRPRRSTTRSIATSSSTRTSRTVARPGSTRPKSNWANPIETAPFYAYPVTCGVTFTFGGLKGDSHGRVLQGGRRPDPRAVRLRRGARRAVQRQLPRGSGWPPAGSSAAGRAGRPETRSTPHHDRTGGASPGRMGGGAPSGERVEQGADRGVGQTVALSRNLRSSSSSVSGSSGPPRLTSASSTQLAAVPCPHAQHGRELVGGRSRRSARRVRHGSSPSAHAVAGRGQLVVEVVEARAQPPPPSRPRATM
jgi:hypothetical protein